LAWHPVPPVMLDSSWTRGRSGGTGWRSLPHGPGTGVPASADSGRTPAEAGTPGALSGVSGQPAWTCDRRESPFQTVSQSLVSGS